MNAPDPVTLLADALQQAGFTGDFERGFAERLIAATDNSIYHVMPKAIVYPRSEQDIGIIARSVYALREQKLALCARGGGTGTNGQSLSHDIIVDCARHLNNILEFDAERKTVSVQPGVVLDQLNAFLRPHGLFFPIDISSSSRATIGGMVGTDASGTGSLIYGKTGDHILALDLILADGSALHIDAANDSNQRPPEILRSCRALIEPHQAEIARVFPKISRPMSGYNLQQALTSDGFNACYLVAGSEGTLGLLSRITLKLTPHPTHQLLTVLFYDDFMRSLEHIGTLLRSQPAAIEMLDDKVLELAQQDNLWFDVQRVLNLDSSQTARSALFIEHRGFNEADIEAQRQALQDLLVDSADFGVFLQRSESDPALIASLWGLRKRAVGLLGKLKDGYQGVAFVEDSAVPAQNLLSYIRGFRHVLDEHGLQYGMYGHADAGVLHVRPALDMTNPEHRALIRPISDQVAKLALENGGVLWGEHGRGFRGEYVRDFFGDELTQVLSAVKRLFDPHNLLNPGKLVSADPQTPLIALDIPEYRGARDAEVTGNWFMQIEQAMLCNGNAACQNATPGDPMCPSYKATRNKLYSPKGRAAMLREWARLHSTQSASAELSELEQSLYDSLQHCLSCRSCSSACPVNVDIPEYKSRFMSHWYQQHPRPIEQIVSRHFETLTAVGARLPQLANALLDSPVTGSLFSRLSKLHELPRFSTQVWREFPVLTAQAAMSLNADDNSVILLRENYLNAFDRAVLIAGAQVLKKMGFKLWLSQPIRYGKLLHNRGMREAFTQTARRVTQQLEAYATSGAKLVSIETMARLISSTEYAEALGYTPPITIQSLEELLASNLHLLPRVKAQSEDTPAIAQLFPHCQEQSSAKDSMQQWVKIFAELGITLQIELAGCCGMSGIFGHEHHNRALSKQIFAEGWGQKLRHTSGTRLLATGFSCRCQLHNHQLPVQHPVQWLAELINPLDAPSSG